jgi:hypothetical protein
LFVLSVKIAFYISNFLLDDAGGSMDLWATKEANIPYSYALEIGPLDTELELIDHPNSGFFVEEKHIKYIVERAYYGIHQYLRSFLDKLTSLAKEEIRSTCLREYNLFRKFH